MTLMCEKCRATLDAKGTVEEVFAAGHAAGWMDMARAGKKREECAIGEARIACTASLVLHWTGCV